MIPISASFAPFIVAGILIAAMAALASGRWRYDVVALAALLAAIVTGVVPTERAFTGFSDDIVIIVGSALVVSAAVARSGVAEILMRRFAGRLTTTELQLVALVATVAVLSAFMKNIGALAIMMPIAFQVARRNNLPVSRLLMPLAFGSLLGGTMTLIGTSPNVIASRMRQDIVGEPFAMFDFFPVGVVLTAAGILFLSFGWRLLPVRTAGAAPENLFSVEHYQSEVLLPEASPLANKRVRDLEAMVDNEVTVTAIIRENARRYVPASHWVLYPGDVLVLQCDAHALARLVADAKLELMHDKAPRSEANGEPSVPASDEELTVVEAVVRPESMLVDRSPAQLLLRDIHDVNLLAVGRQGGRITTRLRSLRFRPGDVLVLRLRAEQIADRLATLGLLPLAERRLQLGRPVHRYVAPLILAAAMVAAATGAASVAVAFFAAAVAVLLTRALTLKEAYDAVDWPILILLGALIPISEALRLTGGTDAIAGALFAGAQHLPPWLALGLVMAATMAITPFLNNAATVLVMGPIGAALAAHLGVPADPYLMAVAIGAACDFLTPVGHQCNTLVMGPGGYRFGDYWRLGLPLTLLVLVLGTPAIMLVWPLGG